MKADEQAAVFEVLTTKAETGDPSAKSQLIEQLWPILMVFVRSNRSMGSLAQSEDHVRNAVQVIVQKVSTRLDRYVTWRLGNPEKGLLDWVRIVGKNAIRDYVRAQLGARRPGDAPSAKRLLNEFASPAGLEDLGYRPPFTTAETARELIEFARSHLSPEQLRVLGLWLEGVGFEQIGGQLGSSAAEASRILHAGIAILRRHFR